MAADLDLSWMREGPVDYWKGLANQDVDWAHPGFDEDSTCYWDLHRHYTVMERGMMPSNMGWALLQYCLFPAAEEDFT